MRHLSAEQSIHHDGAKRQDWSDGELDVLSTSTVCDHVVDNILSSHTRSIRRNRVSCAVAGDNLYGRREASTKLQAVLLAPHRN